MHPRYSLGLGYLALGAVVALACSCVPVVVFKQAISDAVADNGTVSGAVGKLDDACQAAQNDEQGLAKCRDARSLARAALRHQLDRLSEVSK